MMLCFVILLGLGAAPSSQPAVATSQPTFADTRPEIDDSLKDRPLGPEEKKAYLAALAQNRKSRLAGVEAMRGQLKIDSAQEDAQYNKRFQDQLKQMHTNENARDKAAAQKNNTYNGVYQSTHANRVHQNDQEMEKAKADRDKGKKIIAEVNRRLDCLDARHNACLEFKTNTEYHQMRKAAVNRKRADVEHRRIDAFRAAPYTIGRNIYHLGSAISAVDKEYRSLIAADGPAELVKRPELPKPIIQPLTPAAGLVTVGMKRADVQQLMGAPSRAVGLKWYYERESGATQIITFDSTGKVASIEQQ